MIGPRPNLLGHQAGSHKRLEVAQPILTDAQKTPLYPRHARRGVSNADAGCKLGRGKRPSARGGAEKIVLGSNRRRFLPTSMSSSFRTGPPARIAFRSPRALATAAVHHHLIRQGLRMQTRGSWWKPAKPWRSPSLLRAAGYGAEAVNPYLAFETLAAIRQRQVEPILLADRGERLEGEIGIDRFCAIARKHAEMMDFAGFAGFHHEPGLHPQALPDQVMVDRRGRERGGDRNAIRAGSAVRNDEDVDVGKNRLGRFPAQSFQRRLERLAASPGPACIQRLRSKRPVEHVVDAADLAADPRR